MPADLSKLPEAERHSLTSQNDLIHQLAGVMALEGAKVVPGNVMHAMARLGLRFVSVDDGDIHENALDRYDAVVVERDCSCGDLWQRLRDRDLKDWWHRDDDYHYTRKCPRGRSRVKIED